MHDPQIIKQLQLSTNAPSPAEFASAEVGRQKLRREIEKFRINAQYMDPFVDFPRSVDSLCSILRDDVDRQYFRNYPCLSHGNCSFDSILASFAPGETVEAFGMTSWENAGFCGRGVNGDIAQLCAELEAYRLAVWCQESAQGMSRLIFVFYRVALSYLLDKLLKQYKRESKWLCESRTSNERQNVVEPEEPQLPSLKALERSVYLVHGLYLANAAFEKPWCCRSQRCSRVNGQHTTVKHHCMLVAFLFRCGLQILALARENEEEFRQVNVKAELTVFRAVLGGWQPRIVELFHDDLYDSRLRSMVRARFF
ncbi:hypothetical protein AYL99_04767 [Fonsecaea erecta]|uniref:Uncharacterized protein n=1 Tax=Fonsecaea erecta TaxID=1367422 RepID=A0A178ZL57_9EURO|nr:hypothetical protein AYL99_04767 [Fonsecaea erecta]OAP59765.1 hypothetical protein AYL99_04767 [Fonsecaea erecta]